MSHAAPSLNEPDFGSVGVLDDAPRLESASAAERALIERARGGDAAAVGELYRAWLPRIYAFAYRRSMRREVAQDVTSATFERAVRYLATFEWRAGGFGPWLFRICANELTDHFQREQRAAALATAASSRDTTTWWDDVERVDGEDPETARMLAALTTLRPRYQQVISLRYLAGLSADDAARAAGTSKPVLAVTLHRAMAALRKAMER